MCIERCQFLSSENAIRVSQRKSIVLNVNANDVKLRYCRSERFKHFAVMSGQNHLIVGNHFFQGDTIDGGICSAAVVLAEPYASCIFTNNYVDNAFLEWTNEREASPNRSGGFSFSSLDVTSNIFLSGDVSSSFSFLVVTPYGSEWSERDGQQVPQHQWLNHAGGARRYQLCRSGFHQNAECAV